MSGSIPSSRVLHYVYPSDRVMHRGAGIDAPENTIEAFVYGLENYNSHAIEFDVQLSGDDIPILIHDAKMGRTVDKDGLVTDYKAHELCKMDAGSWHSSNFKGATVPLYEDVVTFCRKNNIWMNVEVKGDFKNIDQMRKIGFTVASVSKNLFIDILSQDNVDYNVVPLISSFSVEALEDALIAAPEVPRALLVRGLGEKEGFISDMEALLKLLIRLEATACHINHVGLLESDVSRLLAEGFSVLSYTVNAADRALELLSFGVQSICTDNFDLDNDMNDIRMNRSKL